MAASKSPVVTSYQYQPAEHSRIRPHTSVSPYWYWASGVLLLLPVWLPKYLATEDGLAHLYWVEVYRSLGNPDSPFGPFFVRNLVWNSPHHLLHFGLQYGLAAILEPHLAQKVVVSLVVLSWVAAIQILARAMSLTLPLGAYGALLLIHSSWLYNGLFAFMGAIPLLLVGLALLARLNTKQTSGARIPYYVAIGCLGVMAHYAHFFVGALFLLLVLAWAVFPWHPTRFRRSYLLGAMLPTAFLATLYLIRGTLGSGGMTWESGIRVVARFVGLAFFRGLGSPTVSFWIALAAFGVVLAVLCVSALRTGPVREMPQIHRFVILFAGFLCVVYFVAPVSMGEAYPFNGRLQFAALALLLPSLPCRLPPQPSRLVLGAVSLLLAWQVITFSARELRFSDEYADVLRQAEALPPGTTIASSLSYANARYEGSFIHVLASVPDDIAYRRRAILLNSYFPRYPYYWVRPRSGSTPAPDFSPHFHVDLERGKQGLTLLLLRAR